MVQGFALQVAQLLQRLVFHVQDKLFPAQVFIDEVHAQYVCCCFQQEWEVFL